MKYFLMSMLLFVASQALAMDTYEFVCDNSGILAESIAGLKKAPVSPVVGLNIKVITTQPTLYLIKAKFNGVEKNLFATDWVPPTQLSQDGEDLLSLLSLFYDIKLEEVESLRAAMPTDLLETFAYLEVKNKAGVITKLGFQGTTPVLCK